jgi:hypothetical protein
MQLQFLTTPFIQITVLACKSGKENMYIIDQLINYQPGRKSRTISRENHGRNSNILCKNRGSISDITIYVFAF